MGWERVLRDVVRGLTRANKRKTPLRLLFDRLDADGSGTLSIVELTLPMRGILNAAALGPREQRNLAITLGDGDVYMGFKEFETLIGTLLESGKSAFKGTLSILRKRPLTRAELLAGVLFGSVYECLKPHGASGAV